MNKLIANRLNDLAQKLPLVFEEKPDKVLMSGEELKLTPYDDLCKLIPTKIYEVPIPKYVAVLHEQQLKDAFKREGWNGVEGYVHKVMSKINYKWQL